MAETKPLRLVQAAKKFNVGTDTIVDTLSSGGFDVDNKPSTKLSVEMVELLAKEFQHDIELRNEAEQVTLGTKKHESLEIGKEKEGKKEDADGEELLIQDSSSPSIEKPAEEKQEEPVAKKQAEAKAEPEKEDKAKLSGPKVVGKIDLDAEKKKKEEAKKAKEKEEEEKQQVAEEPAETKEKPAAKEETKAPKEEKAEEEVIKANAPKLEGPKILGKIELQEPKPRKKEKEKEENKTEGDGTRRRRRRIRKGERIDPNRDSRGRGDRKGKKPEDQPAVSEKEIEEKIKATMAKLSGGGDGKGKSRSKHRRAKRQEQAEAREEEQLKVNDKLLQVTEFISVSELAALMDVSATEVISTTFNLGVIVSINQRIDAEIIELVADEFGFEVEFISTSDEEGVDEEMDDDSDATTERAPIVTIMGHVDHGKTSLLDHIREENVASGEAGGITQHIGAYEVAMEDGRKITFLDTPGHEAFTAMRARGAKLTDVAVIVIAADDQVMPQTREAISHAQSAGVPMIFAFNKMDKDGANADVIRQQLSEMNILVEDWGGKFQCQEISAKKGTGVDELLEKILLEAEMLELKANPDRAAQGAIIEASLDKGRGYQATALVQRGTLKIGDMMVAGSIFGKIKAMFDHTGKKKAVAGPAVPVQILGLNGAPQAGEMFKIYTDESEAKNVANKRQQIEREQGIRTQKHITLDEIGRRLALGTFKELNVIIKGDVDGSVEALSDSLQKLSTDEVQVNVLHKAVGGISESDVLLASASDAVILGFQVRPSVKARQLAEAENIEIRMYSVIYDAIDEIKSAMEGMLEPKIEEKITGNAEIQQVFKISKVGKVAGCMCVEGKIKTGSKVRLIRDGIVVYTGELEALKRFKDDVKEVSAGQDCGMSIKGFSDYKAGDFIEAYEEFEIQRKL